MAENNAPRGVQIGIDSIAKHIAAPARDCGIPEQYDEIVRRAKDALTIRADLAAPCRELDSNSSQATHGITSPTLTPEGNDLAKMS